MSRKPYPSDLTEAEWTILELLVPAEKPISSPGEVELREIVNAVMYVSDNGIKSRDLPHNFPA
jgi:transposase